MNKQEAENIIAEWETPSGSWDNIVCRPEYEQAQGFLAGYAECEKRVEKLVFDLKEAIDGNKIDGDFYVLIAKAFKEWEAEK